ncbi:Hypothetical protein A7982_04892 [Minicystis rosea]|nr:Hypothetical protein A7982_04892 [Minicystis rosea]
MYRPSWSLALVLCAGLISPGCRRDKDSAPGLSSGAPADGAALDPSGSAEAPSASGSGDADPPPPPSGPTLVDLKGNAHPPAPIPDGAPRIASTTMLTEVRSRPDPNATKVGYLRAGAVVETEAGEHGRNGCPGGWRKLKPYGYACVGPEATLDLAHPIARALTRRPDYTQKLPYMYGIATRGGPVYARLPNEAQLKEYEPHLKKHLTKWAKDKESGATYGLDVWLKWRADKDSVPAALDAMEGKVTDKEIPWFLQDGKAVPNLSGKVKTADAVKIDDFAHHNGVAFVESFLWEGRRYNVSTDLRVLPADRFRPIRGSEFHGWVIGEDIDFPFALVRKKGAKKYRFDGKKMVSAGDLEWRSAVKLTGKQKMEGSRLFYETADGFFVDDRSAGRVDPAKKMPGWGKKGEKWIDVNLSKQVLVAYEGEKPVYATLVSSGEAGLGDPEKTKSTKRGIFRIHTKYMSITMDSNVVGEEFELRDVPYVQYFENGYALHGAYWHDMFGTPKSHGCVNLAPEDARRLFFWTEPQIPRAGRAWRAR